MMPHATALGFHELANGTSTSVRPKWTNWSSMIDTTWSTVKTTAAPPRNRCMSSSQFGRGRLPNTLVLSASPNRTLAVRRAQATMPPDRAVYHQSWVVPVISVLLWASLHSSGSAGNGDRGRRHATRERGEAVGHEHAAGVVHDERLRAGAADQVELMGQAAQQHGLGEHLGDPGVTRDDG